MGFRDIVLATTAMAVAAPAAAQFERRYPAAEDYGHQIYLEEYQLPMLSAGPIEPAPSPDGRNIAFAAQGFLWLLDLETGVARQLTDSPAIDARPRWSPDGSRIAFVRDDGLDTEIIIIDRDGNMVDEVASDFIELDPEFSADGRTLYFASGKSGTINLWRRNLATGEEEELTDHRRTERNARRAGNGVLYKNTGGALSQFFLRSPDGSERAVLGQDLANLSTADVHPGGKTMVVSLPEEQDDHLFLVDMDQPVMRLRLTSGPMTALDPAFSADGETIYFTQSGRGLNFRLMQVPRTGGAVSEVPIRFEYAAPTARLTIRPRNRAGERIAARIELLREDGHPVAAPRRTNHFDSVSGRHYFYVNGNAAFDIPQGRYRLTAMQGPFSTPVTRMIDVGPDGAMAEPVIDHIWDARAAGYVSADYHVHLNADGPYRLMPPDVVDAAAGEQLDQVAPMAWNRWTRRVDENLVGLREVGDQHVIMSQEVRSHFHGHVGLIGAKRAFYPWFWGPGTPNFGRTDYANKAVLDFAAADGSLATYVHPMDGRGDPFPEQRFGGIPPELVTDLLLDPATGLEIVCQWTDPVATSELWYRFLNLGLAIPGTSGTDSFFDFYRTPAAGTARAYLRTAGDDGFEAALLAMREGRSFLSTGPALVFSLGDEARPGDVTTSGSKDWSVDIASGVPLDRLEIIVNGSVVETIENIPAGTSRHGGSVDLPEGGWVAARAVGSQQSWPSMTPTPFAHASPIWIGARGSSDASAVARSANELLGLLAFAEETMRDGYDGAVPSSVLARQAAARAKLDALLGD